MGEKGVLSKTLTGYSTSLTLVGFT